MNVEIEIQIGDDVPFIPEEVRSVGFEYGTSEQTKPEDKIRHSKLTSRVVILDYTHNGKDYRNFYKTGVWSNSVNGIPRFTAVGLLEFNT